MFDGGAHVIVGVVPVTVTLTEVDVARRPAASRARAASMWPPAEAVVGIPVDGVRRRGDLGAERGAVEQELDPGHADIVERFR